jgi:hypothetical protein
MTTRRKIQNRQRTKNVLRRIKRRNDKIHKLLRSRKNKATRKYSQQKSKMIGGYGGADYVAFNIYFYPEDIAGEYKKKRAEVMNISNHKEGWSNPRSDEHDYLFGGPNPRFCVPYYDEYLFAVIVYDSNNLYVFDNPKFNLGGEDKKNEKLRLLIKTLFGIDFSKDPNAYKSVDSIIFDKKIGKGVVLKPKEGLSSMTPGTHKLQQSNIQKSYQIKGDPYEDMNNVTPVQRATNLLTDFKTSTLRELKDTEKLKRQESLKSQLEVIIKELQFGKFEVEPTKEIFPVYTPWDAWNKRNSNNYYEGLLKGRSPSVIKECNTQYVKPTVDEAYDISDHIYDGNN